MHNLRLKTTVISMLITRLYSVFRKISFEREDFALVDIGIVSVFESLFQLFQLVAGKYRSTKNITHAEKTRYL